MSDKCERHPIDTYISRTTSTRIYLHASDCPYCEIERMKEELTEDTIKYANKVVHLQAKLSRYEEAVRVEGFIGQSNNLVLYESHNKFDMEHGQKVTVLVMEVKA